MPFDSAAISQLTGMYQQQSMHSLAYSQQIGMGSGQFGDRMMGGAMNAAGAIGSPAMSAMGTLAPMGISAGLGLGIGASTGIGLPIAAGVSAMQYAGSQMYTGAQQQQSLNAGMRGSFGFQNQYGGQGFGRADMSQVGGMVRSMSEQIGPGGQMASFSELSSIASKMGGMGLAQGVKDVQEFSKKFKETITALKTMAKDLGTSLEGAMEFAQQARGSGVFGMNNAAKFTSMARGTAATSGLAMSEVTSMANIGSQISRSIGGLGRQGAVAGMKTIGQIGTAQQMGILSDEDIYNVTGQTGAEGRQAFAASQMQKSGSFLQSGKGRRMLASMADKNGQLDATGVMMMMSGGMGVQETMSMDKQRVTGAGAPVNRANFIRNEGRLRGQALQEFGAFLPGMQMMQWAQSKGVDVNNMDDRSMLFMQRQLGMGRDEADQAVKMAQNMPRIMEEMRVRQNKDSFMQDYSQSRKGAGIEGLKTRFENARDTVNSKLQKIGQDFFNEGSETIEAFVSKLTGDYKQRFSDEAYNAYRASSMGGSKLASQNFDKYVGKGGLSSGGLGASGIEGFTRGANLSGGRGDTTNNALRGALGDFAGSKLDYLMRGESDASRFSKAGYNVTAKDNAGLSKQLQHFGDIARAASEPADNKYLALGASQPDWIRDGLASGSIAGSGTQRLSSFGDMLNQKGTQAQKDAWNNAKSDSERARIMNGMAQGSGMGAQGGAMALPSATSAFFGNGMTEGQRRDAFAKSFAGDSTANKVGRGLGAGIGAALSGGILSGLGGRIGANLLGDRGRDQALGGFLDSAEASSLVGDLHSSDARTRDAAKLSAQQQMANIQLKKSSGGKLTDDEKAKLIGLGGLMAASEYEAAVLTAGGDPSKLPKGTLEKIAAKFGVSADQIPKMAAASKEIEAQKARENLRGLAIQVGGESEKRLKQLTDAGVARYENGQIVVDPARMSKMGKQSQGIAQALLHATSLEQQASVSAKNNDLQTAYADLTGARDARAATGDTLASMSVAEKRKVAMELSKGGLNEEARGILASAASQDRITKLNRKKGDLTAVSTALGIELDADTMKAMKGATAEEKAKLISQSSGMKGGLSESDLTNVFKDLSSKGGGGKAAQILQALQSTPDFQKGMHDKLEEKQRNENPLQDAMAKSLDDIAKNNQKQVDLLKVIGMHTGDAAADIKKLNSDGESGTKTAEQPGKPGK